MLQGIESPNSLKVRAGARKSGCTAITVKTKESTIKKKRLVKGMQYLWVLTFFKHLVYPHGFKEDLIVRHELKEKMTFCSSDTADDFATLPTKKF